MEFIVIPKEKMDLIEASISQIKTLLEWKEPTKEPNQWISKTETCRRLNVCSKTLDSYLKKGVLPFTQFKAKIYIKASDVDLHLEKYYISKKQVIG